MHLRTLSPLAAVIAATAALAGCGSSSGSASVAPAAYVKSICSAVAPFERDVFTRSSSLDLTAIKSPGQGKQALQGFLNAVAADTDHAVTKLKSAGTPNVTNGKQIAQAIVNAFAQLKTAMHRASTQATSLPTGSVSAFKTGAQALGTDVRNSMNSIGQNLSASTLKSKQLEQAAAKEPACKTLGG